MKKLFWLGVVGLLIFEILNVYLIMPMPGSQRMNSIDIAYFLYRWRWFFRGLFAALIVIGMVKANWKRKWLLLIPIVILAAVIYMFNFIMSADHMFYKPKQLIMADAKDNKVDSNRLVVGIALENAMPKAYPIRFIGYHHQVEDTINNQPILVTYCTVCRTGRVFERKINGTTAHFRLVGMDHFNAMLEDEETGSWWRQATGEAIAGKLKGQKLVELQSTQTTISKWLELNPQSLIMQADPAYTENYDTTMRFENGSSRKKLTGTDSLSWKNKSWVVGIENGIESKAYDWNTLKKEKIIHDEVGNKAVLLVLAPDQQSFFAYERPGKDSRFTLSDNSILFNGKHFQLNGKGIDTAYHLTPIKSSQEFWHSWQTFHPTTKRY